MDHLLAGTDIRLTYLQDYRALERIDWPTVLDDLTDAGAPPNRFPWCDLDRLTHVVLATDRRSGRHIGVLGLVERAAAPEPFLLAEAAMVRPGDDCAVLMRAMLAHVLARIVCLDGKPAAIVSGRGDHAIAGALRDLGAALAGANFHPPLVGNVIAFRTACLARRVSNGGALMDLRAIAESVLLKDLRRLHRIRPEQRKPTVKPARTGGATPRPRKATRTGRSG